MICQATINDYENGQRFNLARVFVVPKQRSCKRQATHRIGSLCLCLQHKQLALDGLIDEAGNMASRSVIRDVRRYPKKFPGGIFTWARGLTASEIER